MKEQIPKQLIEARDSLLAPDIHGLKRGDIVWIDTSNELGMNHFTTNRYAIVDDSYHHKYGNSTDIDKGEYTLIFLNDDGSLGGSSWYPISALTLQKDLKWK